MTHKERPLLVYFSASGQTERLINKINPSNSFTTQRIKTGTEKIDKEYILITPTYFKGQIPKQVQNLITNNHPPKEVIGTGNRQWGQNFCGAGKKIASMFGIRLIEKVEQSGHFKEVDNILEYFTRHYHIEKAG